MQEEKSIYDLDDSSRSHSQKSFLENGMDFALRHKDMAFKLASKGKTEEAIEHYKKATEINPRDADAYYNLGLLFMRQKKIDDAIDCYRKTVEIEPNDQDAFYNMGIAFRAQGRVVDAISCFRKVVELNSNDSQALINIGSLIAVLGKKDAALVCYQRALEINPENIEVRNKIKQLKDMNQLRSECRNPLLEYFEKNKRGIIDKWMHYFDIYHRYFDDFRGKEVTVVEFGVSQGGSLQMWKNYFGSKSKIVGVDINPMCKSLEEDQIRIYIGDQEDRDFLQTLRLEIGDIHILIDDGGHEMGQQIATFEEMFPAITAGGVYLIEDLHTSYWKSFGGGYKKPGTFIEYSKDLIDHLNAWHSHEPGSLKVSEFTKNAVSMHYYDSVLVIEKGFVSKPCHLMTGNLSFEC